MMKNEPDSGYPDVWSTYLATDDAAATVEAARSAGSHIAVEPMQVMTQGTMAFFSDAGGAMVGAWQPADHKGFTVVGEPGTPTYHELHTRNYAEAVSFYEKIFGWDTKVVGDSDEWRYTNLVHDGTLLAGVMDANAHLPESVPSHWAVYFAVDDIDAVVAKVQELGGSVLQPVDDTPFGRLAMAADPTGAPFRLQEPPK